MKASLLSLAVLLSLAPAVAAAQDAKKLPGDLICDDDLLICRESCSMELGTHATNREKVGKCLYRCEQSHTVCLQRQIAKRQAAPRSNEAPEKKKPVEKEEYFSGSPTRFSQQDPGKTPPPPEEVEEVAPVRRTVTRSTELEAAPDNDPSKYPEREGFVSKGGPTKADRETAARGEEAEETSEEAAEEEVVVEKPKPAPKKKRPATNELGY